MSVGFRVGPELAREMFVTKSSQIMENRPTAESAADALERVRRQVFSADPTALGWDWGSGLLGMALVQAEEAIPDSRTREFLEAWIQHHLDVGTSIHDRGGRLWKLGPGVCVAALWQRKRKAHFRRLLEDLQHYLCASSRLNDGVFSSKEDRAELWVDSLMTLVPFLGALKAAGLAPEASGEAKHQLLGHAKRLQDPQTGLWFHAWDEEALRPMGEFWSRGNGWVVFALVELLEKETSPALRRILSRTVRALLRVQREDGSFHTVLNVPETFVETSGQALLVHGLAKAARCELLPRSLAAAARLATAKGWRVVQTHVTDSGEVSGTSLGTGAVSLGEYASRPVASWPIWGPASVLLAAAEIFRTKHP